MKMIAAFPPAMVVALTTFANTPSLAEPAPSNGELHFDKTLGGDTRLELYDRSGSITLEAGTGDALSVVGLKTGKASDFDGVHLVTRAGGPTVSLHALNGDIAIRQGS